jgi:hypothetical protein
LTDEARRVFQPRPLHEILAEIADQQLSVARQARQQLAPEAQRIKVQEAWTRLLGDTLPAAAVKIADGHGHEEPSGHFTVTRERLEPEPGITIPVTWLSQTRFEGTADRQPRLVICVATNGFNGVLEEHAGLVAKWLASDSVIVLPDIRGTGSTGTNDHGQQSAATGWSATSLMLGQTLLGSQLRDLRTVWRHARQRYPIAAETVVWGGSGIEPLPADTPFSHPRRVNRPTECQPTGPLLALLLALYEEDVDSVIAVHGLDSYRSLLDSPFVQVPHECIVPGVFQAGDLAAIVEVLHGQTYDSVSSVDGLGRLVQATGPKKSSQP